MVDGRWLIAEEAQPIPPSPVAERARVCRKEKRCRKTRPCRANVGAARFVPVVAPVRGLAPAPVRPDRARIPGKHQAVSARANAPADAPHLSADFRSRASENTQSSIAGLRGQSQAPRPNCRHPEPHRRRRTSPTKGAPASDARFLGPGRTGIICAARNDHHKNRRWISINSLVHCPLIVPPGRLLAGLKSFLRGRHR